MNYEHIKTEQFNEGRGIHERTVTGDNRFYK